MVLILFCDVFIVKIFIILTRKKTMMLQFNKTYFGLTILLFAVEVFIALYVHDDFIRPYVGDVLVVVLIYCCIQSFLKVAVMPTAVFVLFFAIGIETLQYCNLVERLGL